MNTTDITSPFTAPPQTLREANARLELAGHKLAAMKEWDAQKGWGPNRKTLEQVEAEHGISAIASVESSHFAVQADLPATVDSASGKDVIAG